VVSGWREEVGGRRDVVGGRGEMWHRRSADVAAQWAAERPLILALFKHNAFEQQQHDAYGTRQLQTHTFTHFDIEAVCALNAATTPAKHDRHARWPDAGGGMLTCVA
jgi:hypothetical protein